MYYAFKMLMFHYCRVVKSLGGRLPLYGRTYISCAQRRGICIMLNVDSPTVQLRH